MNPQGQKRSKSKPVNHIRKGKISKIKGRNGTGIPTAQKGTRLVAAESLGAFQTSTKAKFNF